MERTAGPRCDSPPRQTDMPTAATRQGRQSMLCALFVFLSYTVRSADAFGSVGRRDSGQRRPSVGFVRASASDRKTPRKLGLPCQKLRSILHPDHGHTRRRRSVLRARPTSSDAQEQKPGTARFTGIETSRQSDGATNVLDTVLSVIASDIVSIVLGSIGLLVVVANRLANLDYLSVGSSTALAQQTRTDLLAVFACGSILLNGITKLDVTSALSETVVLEGRTLQEPEIFLRNNAELEAADGAGSLQSDWNWAMNALLAATPAGTVVVVSGVPGVRTKSDAVPSSSSSSWQVLARAGTVPEGPSALALPVDTPILDRVGTQMKTETYLPTLQALPGRFEFTYLPGNSQLALLVPVGSIATDSTDGTSTVLVIGSDTAKSFSPKDVAWARVIAQRMGQALRG